MRSFSHSLVMVSIEGDLNDRTVWQHQLGSFLNSRRLLICRLIHAKIFTSSLILWLPMTYLWESKIVMLVLFKVSDLLHVTISMLGLVWWLQICQRVRWHLLGVCDSNRCYVILTVIVLLKLISYDLIDSYGIFGIGR